MTTPTTTGGRYIIEGVIGSGGMAVVYLARHAELGSLHAVKALTMTSPRILRRLVLEGRAQASIRHPNILIVTDLVRLETGPALVLEYVQGPSLEQLLQSRRLSFAQVDHLVRPILRGVVAAHKHGLVHRDLKPANILLALADGRLIPKIADFGLVKVVFGEGGKAGDTHTGAVMGTPAYMAPEQVRDSSTVDARADVFSLGAILYEMLSGERAFRGEDTLELFGNIKSGHRRPLAELAPGLPERALRAVKGALTTDLEERTPDVTSLLHLWTGATMGAEVALSEESPWEAHQLEEARALASRPSAVSSSETMAWEGSGAASIDGQLYGLVGSVPATEGEPPAPTVAHLLPASVPLAGGPVPSLRGKPMPPVVEPSPSAGHSAPSIETRGPSRSRSRRRWLVLALGLVALGLVALAAWAYLGGGSSPDMVPALRASAGEADRALFAEARRALMAGELPLAERKATEVMESRPDDPGPHLLLNFVHLYRGRESRAVGELEIAARLAGTEPDPTSELSRLALRTQSDADRAAEVLAELKAFIEARPDDAFALMTWASLSYRHSDQEERIRVGERAIAAEPEEPMGYGVVAYLQLNAGNYEAARQTIQAGLEQAPYSPWLRYLLGVVLTREGDHEGAREQYELALIRDGSLTQARAALANTLLALGDDEARRDQVDILTGSTTAMDDRIVFQNRHALVLGNRGRLAEAEVLWQGCMRDGLSTGRASAAARCANLAANIYRGLGMVDEQESWLQHLGECLKQPELGELDRALFSMKILLSGGYIAVARGDLELARDRLTRLEALGEEHFPYVAKAKMISHLQIELAAATGDYERALALIEEHWSDCWASWRVSRVLEASGDVPALTRQLEAILIDDCSGEAEGGIIEMTSMIRLAELSHEAGDRARVEELVSEVHRQWPDADPELSGLKRLEALTGTSR